MKAKLKIERCSTWEEATSMCVELEKKCLEHSIFNDGDHFMVAWAEAE